MSGRKAFTLVELLVVIAIISLLISILAPSLNVAKDIAKQVQCSANMNASSKGMVLYCESNADKWPPYWMGTKSGKPYVKKVYESPQFVFMASKEGDLDPVTLEQIYRGVGIIYNNRFIESPHYLYCPAQFAPSMAMEQYTFNRDTGQAVEWGTYDPDTNMIRMGLLFNTWGKRYENLPPDKYGRKNDLAFRALSQFESDKAMIIDQLTFPWVTAVHTARGVDRPTWNICGPDGSVNSFSSSVIQEILIYHWGGDDGGVLGCWFDESETAPADYHFHEIYELLRTGA